MLADGSVVQAPLPIPALPVSVMVNLQTSLPVLYAGAAPGLVAGILQVNVRIPQDYRIDLVTVHVGSFFSGAVIIAAQ